MSGSPSHPRTSDTRLDELERALRVLERRVAALEPPDSSGCADADAPIDLLLPAASGPPSMDAVSILTLVGRTLMVLGGAYLLRALTESGIWPPAAGIVIGFAYAAAWLVAADRGAAGRSRRLSGIFHGAAAVMIALPVLWESVTRFHVLSPEMASAVLAAITLVTLAAAVHARLQTVAWIAVLGALPASLALTAATTAVLPFAIADIVLGVATLWIGYTADWVWLRWPAALVADVAVIALAAGVAAHTTPHAPSTIVAVQLLLLSTYLASIAIRTLVRGREVLVFEAVQSTTAIAVGLGGAAYVAQTTGTAGTLLVTIALTCGVGSYAVAFAFVMRRQGVRLNFLFYTTIALVLVLAGSAFGLPEPAVWWSAVAIACAWAARRAQTRGAGEGAGASGLLTVHAAAYVTAAAVTSGLLGADVRALTGAAIAQSPVLPRLFIVFAAAGVCWIAAPVRVSTGVDRGAIARAVIGLLVTVSAAAWFAALMLSDGTAPGVAAAVRTGTLAATALTLAWLGRTTRLTEAAWLVYPMLAAGAVKLLMEDLPKSSAAALFVALATYGAALIIAPRLHGRRE